jgi:translation initiation factor 1
MAARRHDPGRDGRRDPLHSGRGHGATGRDDPREGATQLVYSTEGGRRCRTCGELVAKCTCRIKVREASDGDGRIRVRRETQGRGGKTVTTIAGVALNADALRDLAGELKRLCGCGGAVKNGVIEIQGDHCDRILAALRERGMDAIRAGG